MHILNSKFSLLTTLLLLLLVTSKFNLAFIETKILFEQVSQDIRVKSYVLQTFESVNDIVCGLKCLSNSFCIGFNYGLEIDNNNKVGS